jgi:gas vesicle protein
MTNSKVLWGFLAGAAIGGALGILLAPDKGTETRRKIMEKGSDISDSFKDKFNDVKDRFNDVKEKFNDVVDEVKDNYSKMKGDARSAN